ncbi:MAG: iron-sulfur cluster assembly accessory protein [Dehalococcoidia bacterium]|nr:iron-sulfur cluster assembly accessory protein [Dehalococcoidia bacterium]
MADKHTGPDKPVALHFTVQAVEKLNEVVAGQPKPVAGLRLQLTGRPQGDFEHLLSIVEEGQEDAGDVRVEVGGLSVPVFVEGRNIAYLNGLKIQYEYKGPDRSGLEYANPNPLWLGEAEMAIQEIIETELNPQIAAHGGFISLLAVEGNTAYIQMGGGCQGCGMADVTLKQGVEASIIGVVPGIEHVVDNTDHASGTNPYYEPSKK